MSDLFYIFDASIIEKDGLLLTFIKNDFFIPTQGIADFERALKISGSPALIGIGSTVEGCIENIKSKLHNAKNFLHYARGDIGFADQHKELKLRYITAIQGLRKLRRSK